MKQKAEKMSEVSFRGKYLPKSSESKEKVSDGMEVNQLLMLSKGVPKGS